LESARAAVAKALNEMPAEMRANAILGGLIHEDDSPGNYSLRETEQGFDILLHDAIGQPYEIYGWGPDGIEVRR
jgi:hypothetical protein